MARVILPIREVKIEQNRGPRKFIASGTSTQIGPHDVPQLVTKDSVRTKSGFAHTVPSSISVQSGRANDTGTGFTDKRTLRLRHAPCGETSPLSTAHAETPRHRDRPGGNTPHVRLYPAHAYPTQTSRPPSRARIRVGSRFPVKCRPEIICSQRHRATNHLLIIWRVTELYDAQWRRRRRRCREDCVYSGSDRLKVQRRIVRRHRLVSRASSVACAAAVIRGRAPVLRTSAGCPPPPPRDTRSDRAPRQ